MAEDWIPVWDPYGELDSRFTLDNPRFSGAPVIEAVPWAADPKHRIIRVVRGELSEELRARLIDLLGTYTHYLPDDDEPDEPEPGDAALFAVLTNNRGQISLAREGVSPQEGDVRWESSLTVEQIEQMIFGFNRQDNDLDQLIAGAERAADYVREIKNLGWTFAYFDGSHVILHLRSYRPGA